jgi:hypothetical protein
MGKATAQVFLGAFIAAALVGGDPAGAGPVEDAAAAYRYEDVEEAVMSEKTFDKIAAGACRCHRER